MSGPGRWRTPSRRAVRLRGRQRECARLDQLLAAVQAGESRVLVLRGDAGVGKSALLDHLAGQASGYRVARASGVQSEMELAYAGLHQLLAQMLHRATGCSWTGGRRPGSTWTPRAPARPMPSGSTSSCGRPGRSGTARSRSSSSTRGPRRSCSPSDRETTG
jgi:AAA ATPase domain